MPYNTDIVGHAEAPAEGSAGAGQSDWEAIQRLTAALRCDPEEARHTLEKLRAYKEQQSAREKEQRSKLPTQENPEELPKSAEQRASREEKFSKEPKRARIEEFQYSAEKKWVEWRTKATRGPVTDDLSAQYLALANDTNEARRRREAAMLFAVAEAHLNDNDDYLEGLKAAKEALQIYTELGDARREADSLRLIVHAYRLQADLASWELKRGDVLANSAIANAEKLATAELAKFRSGGELRGQAAMLLSLAELALEDWRVSEAEGFELGSDRATRALAMFRDRDVADSSMEARALLVRARAFRMKHRYQEAIEEANSALTIFRSLGDTRNEFNAMYMLVALLALDYDMESAIELAQDALPLSQSLGAKKLEAFQLTTMASLELRQDKPSQALNYAREAHTLFLSLSHVKGWASAAESIMVDALIALEDDDNAVVEALDGLERSQQGGDKREEVFAQTTVAVAQLNAEELALAMKAADAAVEACRELDDESWEAMASLTVAQVYIYQNEPEVAQRTVQSAVTTFQEEKDVHHEAVCSLLLSHVFLLKGETDSALAAAQQGRELFRDLGEVDQEVVALLVISQAHALRSELDLAISCAEEVIRTTQARNDHRSEALGLQLLSEWYIAKGSFDQGVVTANLMLQKYSEMGISKMEAYALHQVSILYMEANQPPRFAANAAELAVRICQKGPLRQTLMWMKLQAAKAWMRVVELPGAGLDDQEQARADVDAGSRALGYAREAMSFADHLGRLPLQALTCLTYAQALLLTGADAAIAVSERAGLCYGRIGDRWGKARALLVTARASFHSPRGRVKAQQSATEALGIFKSLEDSRWQDVAVELLKLMGVDLRPAPPEARQAQIVPVQRAAPAAAEPRAPAGMDPVTAAFMVQELAKAATSRKDELPADKPLVDMGMDSLTVVSFRKSLQAAMGMKLPESLILDYPSINQISNKLVELSQQNA